MTKIVTNNHRRELVSFVEAGAPADFDYITGEDRYSPRIFSYRGTLYDVEEFMSSPLDGWDGFHSDSFYSGIAVKFLSGDDDGFVVAALVMS